MSDVKLESTGVPIRMIAFHDYTVEDHDWADYNTDDHTFAGAVEVDRGCAPDRLLEAFDNDEVSYQFIDPTDSNTLASAMYQAFVAYPGPSAIKLTWNQLSARAKSAWQAAALVAQTFMVPAPNPKDARHHHTGQN